MFLLMLQKLMHKKWMFLCLLIGNILLIAVAVSHPMYRTSSFQRMLTDEFRNFESANGKCPAAFSLESHKSGNTPSTSVETIQKLVDEAKNTLGVPLIYENRYFSLNEVKINPIIARDAQTDRSLRLSCMTNMWDHIELVSGRFPSDEVTKDGFIEVIVSEDTERVQDLLLDEEFECLKFTDISDIPYKVRITGIFKKTDSKDYYWPTNSKSLLKDAFVSEELFRNLFLKTYDHQTKYGLNLLWNCVLDYEKIKPSDVKDIILATDALVNDSRYGRAVTISNYPGILSGYGEKAKKVEASLIILQIPALLLLCAFLYMISGQMLSMEQNEISVIKSRGATRAQIIGLYFLQSLFIGIISALVGLPLGRAICGVLGSSSNFLEFSSKRTLEVQYSFDIIYYAVGAVIVGILMTIIPVISYSRLGIVNLKQRRHRGKRSIWKTLFLDVVLLAISLYGFYNYNRNLENIIKDILMGETLDPMIYLSSSLFILGAGLFFLRIQPWIVKALYSLFKEILSPSTYASFLETIRSGKKQEFIMIFMIMTVALGIYNATVARTIVTNAENNATYINATDIRIKEIWSDNSSTASMDSEVEFKYYEPSYAKYDSFEGVDLKSKVLFNPSTKITLSKGAVSATLMGIVPSEFAKLTTLDGELNLYDFYDYLNVLASVENAALVSENFMVSNGLSLGDVITFSETHSKKISATIYGFFSYWPAYEPYSYVTDKAGNVLKTDNYMVVVNLPYLQKEWGVTPYEVWMKTNNPESIYRSMEENGKFRISRFYDLSEIKEDIRTDTLFQGTNGILTMSFIIVLILCAAGYLIYWIMSIRSRELLFGVLRAMGMKRREITTMLVIEQICCGLYSILAGAVVGVVASKLYVPIVQSAYAANNQVMPLKLIISSDDLVKLFGVIFVVMLMCLLVIGRIVAKLNISKALKLGED